MDVLVGSIDVRELLSTQEFDESSPLSAPDLRLLIDRLQVRSLHIKEKVHHYILSHYNDFCEIFYRCSEAVSRTEEISTSVSDVIRLVSDNPIDVEIQHTVEEISKERRELKEKKEILVLVQTILNLMERLKLVRQDLKMGRLINAAEAVRDLRKALLIHEEVVEDREPVVFGLLRKEWMECYHEIQEVLVRLMEHLVFFEPENNIVRVKFKQNAEGIDGVDLHSVLTAMDVVGVLNYGLSKVADLMVKYIITPAVSCDHPIALIEESNQSFEQVAEVILHVVSSSDSKVKNRTCETLYSRLVQVIKFIYRFICFENAQWVRAFGKLTWPRISDLVICNFLSKAVPDDASKLFEFQEIITLTAKFEAFLKEIVFISASDNSDERLSNFSQNVEVHFASRKKIELLARARNLILQCDFALPPGYTGKCRSSMAHGVAEISSEHAVDLLFSPERLVVSKAASQLMEQVHQILQDVCLSSTRVGIEFYHAARDSLLLYEAIVPIKLEKQLNSINQVAVLMHNDCYYLSQEILGLAFEYHPDFPSYMRDNAVFVDLAPRFQQMAEGILQRQIQLISFNLKEAIDGTDGFQNTHQMQHYESAKFSIDQVVFILEKVHILWEPLLLPSTYKRSMCMVLDKLFSRITKDILLLDDMAAEETLQLQRLIQLTLENLSPIFESLILVNNKGELQEGLLYSQLDELIPSLCKIRKLAELLDMPLKSITASWESGELVNCGFILSEVEDFIKAIFTDSPLRKECLGRMESARF